MSRSNLIALVVLSLGSIVFYSWLLHVVIGFSITHVVGISAITIVALAVITYRHIREHGLVASGGADAAKVLKIGVYSLIVAALAWSTIYLRAAGHYGTGTVHIQQKTIGSRESGFWRDCSPRGRMATLAPSLEELRPPFRLAVGGVL